MPQQPDPVCLLLWGKTDKKDPSKYHPLLFHMLDVAAVAAHLWEGCLSARIRRQTSNAMNLDDPSCGRLVSFLAGLHDIGKASPAFQRQQPDLARSVEEAGLCMGRGEPKPHGVITAHQAKALLLATNLCTGVTPALAGILAKIAGAHHGVFPQAADISNLGTDSLGDVEWTRVRSDLVHALWRFCGDDSENGVDLNSVMLEDPATVPVLTGLISVADWIGSNTDYFPLNADTSLDDYALQSRIRAKEALASLGWLPGVQPAPAASFSDIFPFAPNSLQSKVSELSNSRTCPYMMIVEAQMGQGKTEAALYAADSSLCAGQSRGFYVALPTQATSNAMYERVRADYLERRGHTGTLNLQLVHGNSLLSDVARIADIHDESGEDDARISAQSWFTARKRPLLAPFGVGTIDQCLMSVLQTRHWFVRLFGLAHKTVVFDEVHAYDTYMSTILERLIKWLAAVDCTVIILSATLPRTRMLRLVEAYSGRTSNDLEVARYPRITLCDKDGATSVPVERDTRPMPVKIEIAPSAVESLPELVRGRIQEGGCVAVICNTVDRAQMTYQAIRESLVESSGLVESADCVLFHARMPFAWRKQREENILRKFGKPNEEGRSPDRPHRAVVVATQVIEQSLDLDFDWIITDMAPMDLLLQRLGREHRHDRGQRPKKLAAPVYTILCDGETGGPPPAFAHSGIYERYVLLRSWLAIRGKDSITLPDDIDPLVQQVYSEQESDAPDEEWSRALDESREKMEADLVEDSRKAERILVREPDYAEDLIAEFNKQLDEDDNPNAHEAIRAATRDGDPSIQVVCLLQEDERIVAAAAELEVDLNAEPGRREVEALLSSSLSLSSKRIYHELCKMELPEGWRKNPHMRYHRALVFRDGETFVGKYRLYLDYDKGLIIQRQEEGK